MLQCQISESVVLDFYRVIYRVIYRVSIVLIRQSEHEEIAAWIENRLLVRTLIRLKDSWDACAEVLDVMQLVKDVDQSRVSVSLDAGHDLLQSSLIDSSGIGYLDPVVEEFDFDVRANEVIAMAESVEYGLTE